MNGPGHAAPPEIVDQGRQLAEYVDVQNDERGARLGSRQCQSEKHRRRRAARRSFTQGRCKGAEIGKRD
jgi:hypothetical protein